MPTNLTNWDATQYFQDLTEHNRLAQANGFRFCRVSGLEGFEEALDNIQTSTAFVAVSDISDGYTTLNNSPHTRRIKTVYFAMRHALGDMEARLHCFDVMQEIFRQYMSKLILESTRLEQGAIYIDPRISFREMPIYFASGCACAYFQVAYDRYTDLRLNEDEWL